MNLIKKKKILENLLGPYLGHNFVAIVWNIKKN